MPEHEYEDYDDDPGDCFECGGEGFVFDCFDGFCVDAESGCDDCTRPCPECRRRKQQASPELREVLREALDPQTNVTASAPAPQTQRGEG